MAISRRYRLSAGLVVVIAAVAVSVVLTRPASAVTGITVVQSAGTVTDSQPFKFTTAFCPRNTHVLGGGADIVGGGTGVHLTRVQPYLGIPGDVDGVTVNAAEDSRGYDGSWSLHATAICAPPLPGWEIVFTSPLVFSGDTDVSAQADCPAGKKVIGAGGAATAGGANNILDDVMPDSDLSGVTVEAMYVGSSPSTDTHGAQAFAVCVNPLPGQQLVTRKTAASTGNKTVRAPCPSGTRVHGAGAGLSGALGQAHFDRIGVNSSLSRADTDARTDVDGTTAAWSAWSFAICAR